MKTAQIHTPRRLRGVPGGAAAGPALVLAAHLRAAVWNRRAASPEPVQRETLRRLCLTACDTAFGRTHGFGDIHAYEDFRARVPIRDYPAFEPFLARMRNGERNVLWPGLVRYFALSGGTTSGRGGMKYLPVSDDHLRWQTRAAFDVVARYLLLSGDHALTRGYALGLVPPLSIKAEGAVGVSSNPALLMLHAPAVSKLFSLPREPSAALEDFDERLTAIAEAYLDWDVRLLAGTPCWFSLFFDRLLEAARARGRSVETVHDVWPNLRGLITGGARPGPYRPLLATRIGGPFVLVDHYNATEAGLVACGDRLDADDLLMVPDRGVFYEFVPQSKFDRADARRVPLWQVDTGEDYAVVLSSPSGLFGYSLGDMVRFTSTFPHRLNVVGRVHGGLSPAHETTSDAQLELAVRYASEVTGARVVEFTVAADTYIAVRSQFRYVVFIEFDRAPERPEPFLAAFDAEMSRLNMLYGMYRRDDAVLLPPTLVTLDRGTLQRFMDALGTRSVQQKFPHTLDDRRRSTLERVIALTTSA